MFAGGLPGDDGAGIPGGVGVADADGDAGGSRGIDGVLMEHGGAHVGHFPQLAVGDLPDGQGVGHDAGVRRQDAGYVRPVLVAARAGGPGHDGAGDIRAAAGEGAHAAVGIRPVEAGHDGAGLVRQGGAQGLVGAGGVKAAVGAEKDAVGGVDEGPVQEGGHDFCVQVFAAAGAIVLVCAGLDFGFYVVETQINVQIQLPDNGLKAFGDLRPRPGEGRRAGVLKGLIEQIGDFRVVGEPAAGGGDHHEGPAGVGGDDFRDFAELCGVSQGAAAEFDCDCFH